MNQKRAHKPGISHVPDTGEEVYLYLSGRRIGTEFMKRHYTKRKLRASFSFTERLYHKVPGSAKYQMGYTEQDP